MVVPVDRARLRQLIASPTIDAELATRLATLPIDLLVEAVLDSREPWWRQRACARALVGRVPARHAPALFAFVRDTNRTTEVRAAVLAVLSEPDGPVREPLLAWLRAQDGVEQKYDFDLALLRARAALGDIAAAPRLVALAADAWSHRRAPGEELIDALIDVHGLAGVLAALGADSLATLAFRGEDPARRLLGVRLLARADADVKPALADESVIVAHAAHEALVASEGVDDELWDLVRARGPGHLWALVALHRRGHAVQDAWRALGAPAVALPDVPADVREAIVRAYAPGERETDPRWLLEAACLDPDVVIDEDDLLRRAGDALASAGLEPQPPVSAGEEYRQGGGSYHTIATTAGRVTVSTLGPFFRHAGDEPRVVAALQAAGFRSIDARLAGTRFTGLHVYFFGRRDPLPVSDLLFYWQD